MYRSSHYYAIDDLSISRLLLIGADGKGTTLSPLPESKGGPRHLTLGVPHFQQTCLVRQKGDSVSTAASTRWLASYNKVTLQVFRRISLDTKF